MTVDRAEMMAMLHNRAMELERLSLSTSGHDPRASETPQAQAGRGEEETLGAVSLIRIEGVRADAA